MTMTTTSEIVQNDKKNKASIGHGEVRIRNHENPKRCTSIIKNVGETTPDSKEERRRSMFGPLPDLIKSLRNILHPGDTDSEKVPSHAMHDKARISKVRFGSVEFRAYETVASLNPFVTSGPSVELGWKYIQSSQIDCEAYTTKQPPKTGRPDKDVPRLSPKERIIRLRNAGNTDADITSALESTDAQRLAREKSVKSYYFYRRIKRVSRKFYVILIPARFRRVSLGDKLNTAHMH